MSRLLPWALVAASSVLTLAFLGVSASGAAEPAAAAAPAKVAPPAAGAAANGAALSSEEIIHRATSRNSLGFESGVAQVTMVLRAKNGNEQTQKVVSRARKEGGLSRIAVRFELPEDVRGTGFLMIEQPAPNDDDMYLFLPTLKRTRRIAGSQKNGSFMGTDFSFADMESLDVKEATYERQPDTSVYGVDCYEIVATPKRSDSEYSKIDLLVTKKNYLMWVAKYYSKSNEFVKAFRAYEEKQVEDYWIITKAQMWNKKTGHTTAVSVENVRPKEPVDPGTLTPEALTQN